VLPSEPGLELAGVVAGYGAEPVLRDVSLRVDRGEVVGLIGPNGSGKTTLVRVSSRGLAPSAGTVLVCGADPYRLPPRSAARLIAVVPQDLAPAFAYSAQEIVLMGRSPYLSPWGGGGATDWARVREAMRQTDVEHLADRPLESLSGGERQRVVLAQTLAQDASVLLLDEPTTHLDLQHVVDVVRVVTHLARTGDAAVLAVFHDLNLAAACCDRIYAMSKGRVTAQGRPDQVITTELIHDVFGVEAEVVRSPRTGLPLVAPSPVAQMVVPAKQGPMDASNRGAPSLDVR
jgi:iron complex transport system ATP-binding protein